MSGAVVAGRRLGREGDVSAAPEVPASDGGMVWPWQGVRWDLPYIGFLVYVAAIVTYAVPVAREAMIVALVGLPFAKSRIRFPAPFLCLVAYAAIATVGYAGSAYQNTVGLAIQDLWRVVAIIFVAMNVLTDRPRTRFFIFFYLACFALYPVRGATFNAFIYHASEQGRFSWNYIFENPNDLAAFLFLPMGLAAGLLVTERDKRIRLAAQAGLVLMPLIVFLTQSRGAIIALAAVALAVIIGHRQRAKLLLALGVVSVVVVIFAPKDVWSRMQSLGSAVESGDLRQAGDQRSAEQRFEIWKVSMRIIANNPVTGVGYGAYPDAHRIVSRQGSSELLARGMRDAHSTYLETTAETGVPGVAAWSLIFIVTVAASVRARRRLKRIAPERERQIFFLELALLGYGIAAIFGSYQSLPFTYLHVTALWALATTGDAVRPSAAGGALRRRSA